MIIIDTISDDTGFPVLFEATKIYPLRVEYRDNEDDNKMKDEERRKVTRVRYELWATTLCNGAACETAIADYDTPEEAVAVYDDVMIHYKNGARVYHFRKLGEGLGHDNQENNGDSAEDRSAGEADNSDRVPKIIQFDA